jgi:hypothetical protein
MDAFGVAAMAAMVLLDLHGQIAAFVEAVPAEAFEMDETLDAAHRELGSELDWTARFPSDDGAHVRLADAHDAVVHAAFALRVHFELLLVKSLDRQKAFVIVSGELRQRSALRQQRIRMSEVPANVPELPAYGLARFLRPGPLDFGDGDEALAGLLAVGSRLLELALQWRVQEVDYLLGFLAGLVEQLQVGRVGDVGWSACGVYYELAFAGLDVLLRLGVP